MLLVRRILFDFFQQFDNVVVLSCYFDLYPTKIEIKMQVVNKNLCCKTDAVFLIWGLVLRTCSASVNSFNLNFRRQISLRTTLELVNLSQIVEEQFDAFPKLSLLR